MHMCKCAMIVRDSVLSSVMTARDEAQYLDDVWNSTKDMEG